MRSDPCTCTRLEVKGTESSERLESKKRIHPVPTTNHTCKDSSRSWVASTTCISPAWAQGGAQGSKGAGLGTQVHACPHMGTRGHV